MTVTQYKTEFCNLVENGLSLFTLFPCLPSFEKGSYFSCIYLIILFSIVVLFFLSCAVPHRLQIPWNLIVTAFWSSWASAESVLFLPFPFYSNLLHLSCLHSYLNLSLFCFLCDFLYVNSNRLIHMFNLLHSIDAVSIIVFISCFLSLLSINRLSSFFYTFFLII